MTSLRSAMNNLLSSIMMGRPFNPYEYSVDDQTPLFLGQDLRERLE